MTDLSWLSRTELLIGDGKLERLQQSHVLVVGMGGVGSFAAEFICRAGVGQMTIVDGDVVENSTVTDSYRHYLLPSDNPRRMSWESGCWRLIPT